MSEFRGRELKIIIAVLVLSGSFLFLGNVKKVSATFLNSYSKLPNGTLTATEWNNLASDFLNKNGAATTTGPLGIGTTTAPVSGLYVNGPIYATNFSGGFYNGFINASNVMGGSGSSFGSEIGGGNYSFPASVGIGTTNPTTIFNISSGGAAGSGYVLNEYFAGNTDAPFWKTVKGRGTPSAKTASLSGDALGGFLFQGYSGVANVYGAGIFAIQTGAVSTNAPTDIYFLTADGSTVPERMRILSGGNVGIGTTAPNDTFSIGGAGGVAAPAGSSKTGHNFTSTYLSTDAYALTNYGLVRTLIANATSTLVAGALWNGALNGNIYNGTAGAGNVGIGTTNPLAKLDIFDTNGQPIAFYRDVNGAGNGQGVNYNFLNSSSVKKTYARIGAMIGDNTAGAENGTLYFNTTRLGTETTAMSILGSGYVGIGTTAPKNDLQIKNRTILASPVNVQSHFGNNVYYDGTWKLIEAAPAAAVRMGQITGGISFHTIASAAAGADVSTEMDGTGIKMVILNGGNVGIGTTNPIHPLTVQKNQNDETFLFVNNGTDGTAASSGITLGTPLTTQHLTLQAFVGSFTSSGARKAAGSAILTAPTGVGGLSIGSQNSTASMRFYTGGLADANERVTILAGGNVGIGTTGPLDSFSIGNSGAAPAGSPKTGHNYTSTYLSSDNYALVNYGLLKTITDPLAPGGANSLWNGTSTGNIWNVNSGNVGIGTIAPSEKLTVTDGNIVIDGSYGSETLSETDFATHAKWATTGDFNDTAGNAVYSYSSGVGTLSQLEANFAALAVGSKRYEFTYTVSALIQTGAMDAQITTAFATIATALDLSAGTHTVSFISLANPGTFSISVTSDTAGDTFTLDNFSLKQVVGGDLIAVEGLITGGGASGIDIDLNGLAGIGMVAGGSHRLALNTQSGSGIAPLGIYNSNTGVAYSQGTGIEFHYGSTASSASNKTARIWAQTLAGGGGNLYLETASSASSAWNTILTVAKTGNVGIGTTGPTAKLHLYDTASYSMLIDENSANTASASLVLRKMNGSRIQTGSTIGSINFDGGEYASVVVTGAKISSVATEQWYTTPDHRSAALTFSTANSGVLAEAMRIDNLGNVGIGTTGPLDSFSIGNSGAAPAGSPKTGHNYTSTYLSTDNYALVNYGLLKTITDPLAPGGANSLWNGTSTGNIWNVNSGNVGIGTTGPAVTLQVNVAGGTTSKVYLGNGSPWIASTAGDVLELGGNIFFSNLVGTRYINFGSGGAGHTGALTFRRNDDYLGIMTLLDSGNVGIGTTAPLSKLDVNGGVAIGSYAGSNVAPSNGLIVSGQTRIGTAVDMKVASQLQVKAQSGSSNLAMFANNDFVTNTSGSGLAITTGATSGETYTTLQAFGLGYGSNMNLVLNSSGGNVGIGTTGPLDSFSIGNSGAAPAGSPKTGHNYTSTYLSTDNYALVNYGLLKTITDPLAPGGANSLWNGTSTGNIWNVNSGNVGIGTTAPGSLLDVSGTTDIVWTAQTLTGLAKIGKTAAVGASTGSLVVYTPSAGVNYPTGLGITGSYGNPAMRSVINVNAYGVYSTFAYGSDLAFSTTNRQTLNEVMRLTTDGNVGIGTTSPASKLHVEGGSGVNILTKSTAGDAYNVIDAVGDAYLIFKKGGVSKWTIVNDYSAADDLAFYWYGTNPGNKMVIQNNTGNVGIGTTGPVALLDVAGTPSTPTIGTQNSIIRLTDKTGATTGFNIGILPGAPQGTWLQTTNQPGTAAGTYNLLLNPLGGNVGIGTTAPLDSFSIGNSGAAPAGSPKTGHNYTSTYLSTDNYALVNYGLLKTITDPLAPGGANSLWNGTSTGNIWNVNSGNVGIGTTTPATKLQVYGNGARITVRDDAVSTDALNLGTDTAGSGIFQMFDSNGVQRVELYSHPTMATAHYWFMNGNVGIGTTNPWTKLDVQTTDTAGATSTGATIAIRSDAGATINKGGSIIFGDTGTSRAMIKGMFTGPSGSGGAIVLSTLADVGGAMTERMRIDSGGNVGIGTTAPAYKAEVNGTFKASASSSSIILDSSGNISIGL